MNSDVPFTTANDALKNCAGYLSDAIQASSAEDRNDDLDGACEYAQKALQALHDAAYEEVDVGSDMPGIRQVEYVRKVVDAEAERAYKKLEAVTAVFVGINLAEIKLDLLPIDAVTSFMDEYRDILKSESAYIESQPEPEM